MALRIYWAADEEGLCAYTIRARATRIRLSSPLWDTHDLTDFEQEMEEVTGPVFVRAKGASLDVVLPPADVRRLKGIARSMSVKETTVLRQWIVEKLRGKRRVSALR
jgi:hypothetical protein